MWGVWCGVWVQLVVVVSAAGYSPPAQAGAVGVDELLLAPQQVGLGAAPPRGPPRQLVLYLYRRVLYVSETTNHIATVFVNLSTHFYIHYILNSSPSRLTDVQL